MEAIREISKHQTFVHQARSQSHSLWRRTRLLLELDAAPSLSQKHQQIAKREGAVKEKIIVYSSAKAFRGSKKDRSIAE
ncbi:hypothetical protein YC2023_028152 [Brassica napus]